MTNMVKIVPLDKNAMVERVMAQAEWSPQQAWGYSDAEAGEGSGTEQAVRFVAAQNFLVCWQKGKVPVGWRRPRRVADFVEVYGEDVVIEATRRIELCRSKKMEEEKKRIAKLGRTVDANNGHEDPTDLLEELVQGDIRQGLQSSTRVGFVDTTIAMPLHRGTTTAYEESVTSKVKPIVNHSRSAPSASQEGSSDNDLESKGRSKAWLMAMERKQREEREVEERRRQLEEDETRREEEVKKKQEEERAKRMQKSAEFMARREGRGLSEEFGADESTVGPAWFSQLQRRVDSSEPPSRNQSGSFQESQEFMPLSAATRATSKQPVNDPRQLSSASVDDKEVQIQGWVKPLSDAAEGKNRHQTHSAAEGSGSLHIANFKSDVERGDTGKPFWAKHLKPVVSLEVNLASSQKKSGDVSCLDQEALNSNPDCWTQALQKSRTTAFSKDGSHGDETRCKSDADSDRPSQDTIPTVCDETLEKSNRANTGSKIVALIGTSRISDNDLIQQNRDSDAPSWAHALQNSNGALVGNEKVRETDSKLNSGADSDQQYGNSSVPGWANLLKKSKSSTVSNSTARETESKRGSGTDSDLESCDPTVPSWAYMLQKTRKNTLEGTTSPETESSESKRSSGTDSDRQSGDSCVPSWAFALRKTKSNIGAGESMPGTEPKYPFSADSDPQPDKLNVPSWAHADNGVPSWAHALQTSKDDHSNGDRRTGASSTICEESERRTRGQGISISLENSKVKNRTAQILEEEKNELERKQTLDSEREIKLSKVPIWAHALREKESVTASSEECQTPPPRKIEETNELISGATSGPSKMHWHPEKSGPDMGDSIIKKQAGSSLHSNVPPADSTSLQYEDNVPIGPTHPKHNVSWDLQAAPCHAGIDHREYMHLYYSNISSTQENVLADDPKLACSGLPGPEVEPRLLNQNQASTESIEHHLNTSPFRRRKPFIEWEIVVRPRCGGDACNLRTSGQNLELCEGCRARLHLKVSEDAAAKLKSCPVSDGSEEDHLQARLDSLKDLLVHLQHTLVDAMHEMSIVQAEMEAIRGARLG
uniref:Uncharacterized protein n=1 Tax=Compsopogon caeruleus TaxID=31354 RepID=A0A7S1T6K8_9RHOD|mmetsp:Transcript_11646/g.23680  ORF Transcript_11646/g.23680 Transcript_11646/m.23680 type:complete len:1052 (+) Transcript_11646:126-3281(+)